MAEKLALVNGNILTMDDTRPRARAVYSFHGRILRVGSDSDVKPLIDAETEVIDLKGKTVVPGFIDCHAHPLGYGYGLMRVNCRSPPVESIEEIIEKIRLAAKEKPAGAWILGTGYDDFKLAEKRHPNRWDLDKAAPENPVMITRMCGHVSVVNSHALKLAGITRDTPDPEKGQIDRQQQTGEPTGVLRGPARGPIGGLIPPPTPEDMREAVRLAAEGFVARGVTSVSDAGSGRDTVQAVWKAVHEDGIPLRFNLMMAQSTLDHVLEVGAATGFGDDHIKMGALKMVLDGSTTGRTAAVSVPYLDTPGNSGIFYQDLQSFRETFVKAHKAGLQVGVHAIGDRAITQVLDAIEEALKASPRKAHRHRIEHCGICTPEINLRIRDLRALPVPQPIFLWGEGESYRAGLGAERVEQVYPMRSWLDLGIATPMSSDCPSTSGGELISPLLGIHVAVNRRTDADKELGPSQKITPYEGLKAYTVYSAYACFEDDNKGSITEGKLADFAVLEDDPTQIEPAGIKDIRVHMTIID